MLWVVKQATLREYSESPSAVGGPELDLVLCAGNQAAMKTCERFGLVKPVAPDGGRGSPCTASRRT